VRSTRSTGRRGRRGAVRAPRGGLPPPLLHGLGVLLRGSCSRPPRSARRLERDPRADVALDGAPRREAAGETLGAVVGGLLWACSRCAPGRSSRDRHPLDPRDLARLLPRARMTDTATEPQTPTSAVRRGPLRSCVRRTGSCSRPSPGTQRSRSSSERPSRGGAPSSRRTPPRRRGRRLGAAVRRISARSRGSSCARRPSQAASVISSSGGAAPVGLPRAVVRRRDRRVRGPRLRVQPTLWLERWTVPWLTEWLMFSYLAYLPLYPAICAVVRVKRGEAASRVLRGARPHAHGLQLRVPPLPGREPALAHARRVHRPSRRLGVHRPRRGAPREPPLPRRVDPEPARRAATTMLAMAWRHHRRTAWIVAPVVVSLWISTFYCRYHYVTDAVRRVLAALAVVAVTPPLLRAWERRGGPARVS